MNDVIEVYVMATLVYFIASIWWISYIKSKHLKWNNHMRVSGIIFWGSHVFNIVYTGIMGWNMTAQSDLERWLDTLSMSATLLSFIMFIIGYSSAKIDQEIKDKEAKNRRRKS